MTFPIDDELRFRNCVVGEVVPKETYNSIVTENVRLVTENVALRNQLGIARAYLKHGADKNNWEKDHVCDSWSGSGDIWTGPLFVTVDGKAVDTDSPYELFAKALEQIERVIVK